jgi:5-oxoprolinase (ATP-hydrolysing)
VFGPSGDQPLDPRRSRARLQEIADARSGKSLEENRRRLPANRGRQYGRGDPQDFDRAGHDVTRYTLACFGGAGGQHACRSPMRSAWSGS